MCWFWLALAVGVVEVTSNSPTYVMPDLENRDTAPINVATQVTGQWLQTHRGIPSYQTITNNAHVHLSVPSILDPRGCNKRLLCSMCVKAVSYVACRTKNDVLYNVFQLGYQFLQLRPIVNFSVVAEVQELSEPKFE